MQDLNKGRLHPYPVSSFDSPTEHTAEGIKGGAVLLGVQLGNVHQQGPPWVAVLDVAHDLSTLRPRVHSRNLQGSRHVVWCNYALPGHQTVRAQRLMASLVKGDEAPQNGSMQRLDALTRVSHAAASHLHSAN